MPLIDLQTDLKSLKYGQDQPGGGNSGQPYIAVDINRVDTGFNRFRMTKFDDGLIRGGAVGAINASVVDTIRIGKFLTDLPKGPLFIVKQIGLQLSQPQLEYKKLRTDNPTSGGGILGNLGNLIINTANKIQNAVGPTRIYNLGINTLAQVPVNAFGQHIVRHGLLPVQNDDTKYINVAEYNNYGDGKNNRLVGYKSKFQLGDSKPNPTQSRNTINIVNRITQALNTLTSASFTPIKLNPEQLTVNNYIAGPGSIYGIGNTLIRRYTFTEDGVKINFAKNRNYVKQHLPGVKINQTFDFGVSNFSQSTLSANLFNLKQQPFVLSGSFQTYIASANDPKNSKYTAAQQEANASQRIKNFTAASNFSGSTLSTTNFPGLKEGTNIPSTLLNYTASNKDVSVPKNIPVNYYDTLGVSVQYFNTSRSLENSVEISPSTPTNKPSFVDQKSVDARAFERTGENSTGSLFAYSDIRTQLASQQISGSAVLENNIGSVGRGNTGINKSIYNNAPLFGTTTIYNEDAGDSQISTSSLSTYQNAVSYSNPINKKYSELRTQIENQSNIDKAVQSSFLGNDIYNALNVVKGKANPENAIFTVFTSNKFSDTKSGPRYETVINEVKSKFNRTNDINIDDDTMALQFIPLDPFTGNALNTLNFLGYLNEYSEDYNSTWNPTRYVGRAESFYIFNEFKRTANVTFQVPCYNEVELIEKHCAVSELASTLAGKYENNLLGGIITRLKLGNYVNNQPGVITNLNFAPIQESTWDLDLKLAYYLKVTFGFTFIHDYLPQYYPCGFIFKEPEPEPVAPQPIPTPVPEDVNPRTTPDIGGIRPVIVDNTRRQSLLTPGPGAASLTPAERRAIERRASNTTFPDQNRNIQTIPTGPIKTAKLSDVLANTN